MDRLYELVNQSIIASLGAVAFGVLASIAVAAAILWLRNPMKPRRFAVSQPNHVGPGNPVFLKPEERESDSLSAEAAAPFGGIQAALRRARANDLEKNVASDDARQGSSRQLLPSIGRSQVPGPPVSTSMFFDEDGRKGLEAQDSQPTTSDADKSRYPSACIAIEYREDVKKVWEAIGQLSEFVRCELLSALDKDPQLDARDLAATILQKLEEERGRFDSDELNDSYRAAARIGKEAADEFRRVVLLLGATVNPDNVLVKIREKYGERDHPPK